jgi:hypothetical protein
MSQENAPTTPSAPAVDRAAPLFGLVVAVDFDGTCVTHEYPKVGRYIGAEPVLKRMVDDGAKLILWTMRSGEKLQDAVTWFEEREIPLFGVQRNPTQDSWTDSPKAYAKVYIDDAALGVPLCKGLSGERPFVDWQAVSSYFWADDSATGPNVSDQATASARHC